MRWGLTGGDNLYQKLETNFRNSVKGVEYLEVLNFRRDTVHDVAYTTSFKSMRVNVIKNVDPDWWSPWVQILQSNPVMG